MSKPFIPAVIPDIRTDYTYRDVAELVYLANDVVTDRVAHNRNIEGTGQHPIIWASIKNLQQMIEDFQEHPDTVLLRKIKRFRSQHDNIDGSNRILIDMIRATETNASTKEAW